MGTIRQKVNARACKTVSNHGLNGISLHSVGFELFKKVLLVALGILLSIWFLMSFKRYNSSVY